jgi:hypothetical protein
VPPAARRCGCPLLWLLAHALGGDTQRCWRPKSTRCCSARPSSRAMQRRRSASRGVSRVRARFG